MFQRPMTTQYDKLRRQNNEIKGFDGFAATESFGLCHGRKDRPGAWAGQGGEKENVRGSSGSRVF
jgi:hypothetical protein